MVIENHPRLEDGSPFPTLYWLTCPVLVKRVGALEAAGWMGDATRTLDGDPQLKQRFAGALARYRARRDTHEPIKDSGEPPGGGPDRVKCLHAHVAHELASPPNPVGGLVLSTTGFPDCVLPCVARD